MGAERRALALLLAFLLPLQLPAQQPSLRNRQEYRECQELIRTETSRLISRPSNVRLYTQGYYRPKLHLQRGDQDSVKEGEPEYQPFATLYWDCAGWNGTEKFFNIQCFVSNTTNLLSQEKISDHYTSFGAPHVTHIDLRKIYGGHKFAMIRRRQILRCRVRAMNKVNVPEVGNWSMSKAVEIGPDADWSPPPLVTLTFRGAKGHYWAAVLDANRKQLTQLFERKRPALMEMADGKSSSYSKWDDLQAKFMRLSPWEEEERRRQAPAAADVAALARDGLRRLASNATSLNDTDVTEDEEDRLEAEETELLLEEHGHSHASSEEEDDDLALLPYESRFHPRMVNDRRFRSHAYTSDWLNGHSYVAVPGTRNNSIVAMWEYSAHKLLETAPGVRIQTLVFNPFGNELFMLTRRKVKNKIRHSLKRITLYDWKPPGRTFARSLFATYTNIECSCKAVEAEDIQAIALDLRGLLRSGGVPGGARPALVMATAAGNLYTTELDVLGSQDVVCDCQLLLRLPQPPAASSALLTQAHVDQGQSAPAHSPALGPITTLAVSSDFLFYSYLSGPLFMAGLEELDEQNVSSLHASFPEMLYSTERIRLHPARIYDIELNSRSWKPHPQHRKCLSVPRYKPSLLINHITPDSVQFQVKFPLETGNGAECRMFPPPAVYGHVYLRNVDLQPPPLPGRHRSQRFGWAKPEEFSNWRSIVIHNLNSSTTYQLKLVLLNSDGASLPSDTLVFSTKMSRLLYMVIISIISVICIAIAIALIAVSINLAKKYIKARRKETWLRWLVANFEAGPEGGESSGISKLPIIPAKDITDTGQILGHGAFGEVCIALVKEEDSTQQTRVAMKKLNKRSYKNGELSPDMDKIEYDFFCEADAMQRLQTPESCHNMVKMIGISVDSQIPCLLVELMKTDMKKLLIALNTGQSRYTLSEEDAFRLAIDVATGMEFMHNKGWIHRDIRAVNVLLSSNNPLDWVAKIGDLGLSRDLNQLRNRRQEYQIGPKDMVAVGWGAPETLTRPNPVYDFSSDVWSFGVFCWELATLGQDPFKGMHPTKIIKEVVERRRTPGRPDRLSRLYNHVIAPCWAYEGAARPSASKLLRNLKNCLAEEPVPANRGPFDLDETVWVPNNHAAKNAFVDTCDTESTNLGTVTPLRSMTYQPADIEMQSINERVGDSDYMDQEQPDVIKPYVPGTSPTRGGNGAYLPQTVISPDSGYVPNGQAMANGRVGSPHLPSASPFPRAVPSSPLPRPVHTRGGPPPPKTNPYPHRSPPRGRRPTDDARSPLIPDEESPRYPEDDPAYLPGDSPYMESGYGDAEGSYQDSPYLADPASSAYVGGESPYLSNSARLPYVEREGPYIGANAGPYVGGSGSEETRRRATTPLLRAPVNNGDSSDAHTSDGEADKPFFTSFFRQKSRSLRELGLPQPLTELPS